MSYHSSSRYQDSSDWVSFSGDASSASKRSRSNIPVAIYEWPMDESKNDIERGQQTVVMAKQKEQDIEVVLSKARAPSAKTSSESRFKLPLSRKTNTRYQSMDEEEEEILNIPTGSQSEANRILGMLQKSSALKQAGFGQSRAPRDTHQFETSSTAHTAPRHIVSHLQTPPRMSKRDYFPKEIPSSSKTWEESDDSDLSKDASDSDTDEGKSRCSRLLKCFLAVLVIILVVSIGFLLGQWIRHKKIQQNNLMLQQEQEFGESVPTMTPVITDPTNVNEIIPDDTKSPWQDVEGDAAETEKQQQQNFFGIDRDTATEPPAKPIVVTEEDKPFNPAPTGGYDYTANTDYLVGVYYYPWHGANFHNGDGYMRKELVPKHVPALGEYNDSDPGVIAHHMKWFRQANIGLLVTSWWGPNRVEDTNTKDVIMEHEDVGNLKIALHYETTGRIGKQGEKILNVLPDIQYMCENYFDHPNYYKIDGRPVLFIYVSRHLHSVGILAEALLTMRSTASKCGHNLYLIGDSVFESAPDPNQPHSPFWYFDAVTNYDVYGSARRPEGHAGTDAVDSYYQEQAEWKTQALRDNCRYIPAVSPGYNDRGVRYEKDHPPLSRRITSSSREGSLFHYQLKHAKKLVDSEVDKMVLVNSFNEWHEDTQIEPVIGDPAIEPFNFTKGLEYVGYGELYLDILGAATSRDERNHGKYDYLFWN